MRFWGPAAAGSSGRGAAGERRGWDAAGAKARSFWVLFDLRCQRGLACSCKTKGLTCLPFGAGGSRTTAAVHAMRLLAMAAQSKNLSEDGTGCRGGA